VSQAAAKTGAGPTAMVALEQLFPDNQRIIFDDLATWILPFNVRALLWLMRPAMIRDWIVRATETSFPGLWGGIMCRKRYVDEKLIESASQIEAVVNLGAGFDTRLYRLSALAETPAWELDQPDNIGPKGMRLRKVFGAIPAHVTLLPIDFDREDLGAVLRSDGYSIDKRTFFIWEAVTQYLVETGIRATFEFLATAASGSRLAFTYVRQGFLDGKYIDGQERLYRRYVTKDKIWRFGMDPQKVAKFLEPYGWHIIAHLGYEDLSDRYVKSTGRVLASMPVERLVYAKKR
jgi:methyltransferase (TIGR00027 family)